MIHRIMRLADRLALMALVVGALVWVVQLRPLELGGHATYVIVQGSSMLPGYRTGDLVIVRSGPSYSVGQTVAYRVPEGEIGAGQLVLHRLVGAAQGGFVARGDNNEARDPWLVPSANVIGEAWAVVPGAGRLIAFVRQPAGLGSLSAAAMVAFLLARRSVHGGRSRTRAQRHAEDPSSRYSVERRRSPVTIACVSALLTPSRPRV